MCYSSPGTGMRPIMNSLISLLVLVTLLASGHSLSIHTTENHSLASLRYSSAARIYFLEVRYVVLTLRNRQGNSTLTDRIPNPFPLAGKQIYLNFADREDPYAQEHILGAIDRALRLCRTHVRVHGDSMLTGPINVPYQEVGVGVAPVPEPQQLLTWRVAAEIFEVILLKVRTEGYYGWIGDIWNDNEDWIGVFILGHRDQRTLLREIIFSAMKTAISR